MQDYKITNAKIKFIENGEKQIVDTSSILEFKENLPKNRNDFEAHKVYTCLYKDDKYPEPTEYAIQIGRLYGTFFIYKYIF